MGERIGGCKNPPFFERKDISMSADNWTTCPKCEQEKAKNIERKAQEVNDAYGKVSVVEYQHLQKTLDNLINTSLPRTLREDYEIGIDNGVLSINYEAGCRVCKFHYSYRHNESVL